MLTRRPLNLRSDSAYPGTSPVARALSMAPPLPDSTASDTFFDAPDEISPLEPEVRPDSSPTSDLHPAREPGREEKESLSHPLPTPPDGVRRRRAIPRSAAFRRSGIGSKFSSCDSGLFSSVSSPGDERRRSREGHKVTDSAASVFVLDGVVDGEDGAREVSVAQAESSSRDEELERSPPASLGGPLISIAAVLIKLIGFQISLFVSSVTFPMWLLYCLFLLITDPFQTLKRGRDHVWQRLVVFCAIIRDRVAPLAFESLSSQRRLGKCAWKVAIGCFWSFFVGVSLLTCLLSSFLIGRLLMRLILEEPLRFTEELSFDYTKPSPVATVPFVSCHAVERGLGCSKNVGDGKWARERFIPQNHKLHIAVSLTLPESEYNRKLGIFQVKAEVFSVSGKVITSSSRPCMLEFNSPPIQFVKTLVRSAPLLAGYSSEAQVLGVKMRGFTEGSEPSARVRITLERRAEYRTGAGLPEIYAGYIRLESELPLLKEFIWNWRRTLFVWIGIGLFNCELLLILICCAPCVVPSRSRRRNPSL